MSAYRIELDPEATYYQHSADGHLTPVKGDRVDFSRPFFSAPGEHDQGDTCDEDGHAHDAPVADGRCGWCGEGVGGWQDVGYTEERIVVDVVEVRRTAAAIEVVATLPPRAAEVVERRALDGVSIAQRRPVPAPAPFRLPEQLGGIPRDTPEQDRYRLNRADRRRLGKGRRRG